MKGEAEVQLGGREIWRTLFGGMEIGEMNLSLFSLGFTARQVFGTPFLSRFSVDSTLSPTAAAGRLRSAPGCVGLVWTTICESHHQKRLRIIYVRIRVCSRR